MKVNADKTKKVKLIRNHKITISFNNDEQNCIERYIKKNKIKNKTKFCRELLIKTILQESYKNSPTLFD